MIDSHVHIDFENLESELEKYIKKAKEKNIEEFTITNHIMLPVSHPNYFIENNKVFMKDKSFLKCSLVALDVQKYFEVISTKANQNIKIGVEMDYLEDYEKVIKAFIANVPFDLVLGSLHVLEGHSVSRKGDMQKLLTNFSAIDLHKKYFTNLRKLVKSEMCDVLSHVDLIRKHSPNVSFKEYAEEAITLIDDLLEHDIGIEINNSGYRFIGDSYPTFEFLTLCRHKGIEKVTIGSDAHKVGKLGENLEKSIEKLKKVGYKRIVKFKNRQPQYIDL